MAQPDPHADAELIAWLDRQAAPATFSGLAAACAARFGAARAWDTKAIRYWWLTTRRSPSARGAPSRCEADRDIARFIRDRIGICSGDALLADLRLNFPADRVPSRSSLYRFLKREMHRLRRKG